MPGAATDTPKLPIQERLRRRCKKPDGTKRRPTPRELEAAETIDELAGALRWLRAFWRPGSGHDTQEVQHALAAADAALAKVRP